MVGNPLIFPTAQVDDTPVPSRVLEWTGFDGGMSFYSADGTLPPNTLRVMKDAVPWIQGQASYPGGASDATPISSGSMEVYDFIRYRREADADVATAFDRWAYVRDNISLGNKQLCVTDMSNVVTVLSTVTANNNMDVSLLVLGKMLICTSRDNLPVVWFGTGSATTLGYSDPTTSPTASVFSTGAGANLNSTGLAPYQWSYSFEDKWGNQTNPSPLSTSLHVPGNTDPGGTAQIVIPASSLTITGMALGNLKRIYIWRIGGNNSTMRLTLTIDNPTVSGSNFATSGGGILFDNNSDASLPDVFPAYSNSKPPRGFLTIKEHLSRVFGAGQTSNASVSAELGSSSRLWFSRPGLPMSWGYEDNGVDDDGGYLDIDDNPADPIIALESTGSLLVIARRQSIYALFGTGFTNFRFDKRSNVGIPTRKAICRRGNTVCFLGSDGAVYELGDRDPVRIGVGIEKYINKASLTTAMLWTHEGRLYVSIPNTGSGTAFTLVHDEKTNAWCHINRYYVNAAHSVIQPGNTYPSLLTARRQTLGNINEVEYYPPENTSEFAEEASPDLQTDKFRLMPNGDVGRIMEFYIDGFFRGTLNVTFNVEGVEQTYELANPRIGFDPDVLINTQNLKGLPASLQGRWATIRIHGTVTCMMIRKFGVVILPTRRSVV